MSAVTRFVLRHKVLVALFWVIVAAAGIATVGGTTSRMTNSFAVPGQAFRVDNQIVRQYHNAGSQAPYVPVITVPAGQRVTDPAVAAAVHGTSRLSALTCQDHVLERDVRLDAAGVFLMIGADPCTTWLHEAGVEGSATRRQPEDGPYVTRTTLRSRRHHRRRPRRRDRILRGAGA